MRFFVVAALLAAFACSAPSVQAATKAPDAAQGKVGEMFILRFPGNRAAGYRWRLNKERSSGLELVEVNQIAWTIPNGTARTSIFFKNPSILSIRLMPKAQGDAKLAFDYFRTWGNRPFVKTHFVDVPIPP